MKPQSLFSLPVRQREFVKRHWPLPSVSSWRFRGMFSEVIPFEGGAKEKFPYGISKEVFQTKVLIVGTNFLLSALTALSLSRQGVPFLLCPFVFPQEDWWSYDFLKNSSFRRFVEETTRFSGQVSSVQGLGQVSGDSYLSEWIDGFFAYLASEIVRTDFHEGFRMDAGYTYEAYGEAFVLSEKKSFPERTEIASDEKDRPFSFSATEEKATTEPGFKTEEISSLKTGLERTETGDMSSALAEKGAATSFSSETELEKKHVLKKRDKSLAGVYAFPYIPQGRDIPYVQQACEQAFIRHVLKVLPRVDFTSGLKGAHHLFGEAVVLTSLLPAFCPIRETRKEEGRFFSYPLSEVYPFGSARQTPFRAEQAIKETPEDILRLTRFNASFLKESGSF